MPVSIQPSTTVGNYHAGTITRQGNTALFTCEIRWVVRGTQSGYVVQRVQRNEKYRAKVIDSEGEDVDFDVVATADYWEAWTITPNGEAEPRLRGYNDNFGVYNRNTKYYTDGRSSQSCPDKEGTRGRWKIRGTVYYVPVDAFQASGWKLGGVPNAGDLLSRWDPPVAQAGLQRGRTLGPPLCIRQFAGTWDWTNKYRDPVSASRAWPFGGNFDSVDRLPRKAVREEKRQS